MHHLTRATINRVAEHTGRSQEAATDLLIELGYRVFEQERERAALPPVLFDKLKDMREHAGHVVVCARVNRDLAAQIKATAAAAQTSTSRVVAALVADGLTSDRKSA